MPYNTNPIPPPKTITGQSHLPLARVKKILAQDEDISAVSNNAAFVITIAAEMFVQHLVEQTHLVVKTERKVRRNIQYRDVANAVSRIDNLEFLSDVVPKTTTVKKVREATGRKPGKKSAKADAEASNGQMKFDKSGKVSRVEKEVQDEDAEEEGEEEVQEDEDGDVEMQEDQRDENGEGDDMQQDEEARGRDVEEDAGPAGSGQVEEEEVVEEPATRKRSRRSGAKN